MPLPLTFRSLAKPPTKLLHTLRREAGWPAANPVDHAQPNPLGRVQWVSVETAKATIAIARLELAPPEFCYVADLIVAHRHRGQGVGRWFLQRIEQYCAGAGIRRLLLQAAADTEPFYAALQFAPDPRAPGFLKKDINPFQRKMFVP
jgi:GNAT superfamily N-acetyltransferase